jgi:outer membrane protein TolC
MKTPSYLTFGALFFLAAVSVSGGEDRPQHGTEPGPADAIVASVTDAAVRNLLEEVLERNPEIAALEARTAAAGHRAVSAKKLPDPRAELTAFVLPPETRVGPQRVAARVVQQLPGGGKLKKSSLANTAARKALAAEIEVLRLELVRKTRALAIEIAYLEEAGRVLSEDVATLGHFEELARARYATGAGLQMDAVQLQAEMTRLEARQSEIDERRATVAAEINRLRDRSGAPVPAASLEPQALGPLDWEALTRFALRSRPELAADEAEIERAGILTELAADDRTPDFSVGLSYAWVDRRTDVNVPDNGQDVLGLSGGITIPLWSTAMDAEVEAATQERLAREASRRATVASIEREIQDLRGRIPEIARRLALLEDVLPVQAEQSFASAEAAYAAGRVGALALLDAERVLLDVRLSAARARADLALALTDLESAIAAPLPRGESS